MWKHIVCMKVFYKEFCDDQKNFSDRHFSCQHGITKSLRIRKVSEPVSLVVLFNNEKNTSVECCPGSFLWKSKFRGWWNIRARVDTPFPNTRHHHAYKSCRLGFSLYADEVTEEQGTESLLSHLDHLWQIHNQKPVFLIWSQCLFPPPWKHIFKCNKDSII